MTSLYFRYPTLCVFPFFPSFRNTSNSTISQLIYRNYLYLTLSLISRTALSDRSNPPPKPTLIFKFFRCFPLSAEKSKIIKNHHSVILSSICRHPRCRNGLRPLRHKNRFSINHHAVNYIFHLYFTHIYCCRFT